MRVKEPHESGTSVQAFAYRECSLEEEQTEETANEHRKDRIDFLKAREVKSTQKEGYT